MEFFKRHCSTIVLITIAAFWVGIYLGTDDCPSCVVVNMSKSVWDTEGSGIDTASLPVAKKVNWSTVDTEGKLVSHNDFEGKVGVLVYWATWCGSCKSDIPDMIALRNEFTPSELEIVGLSVDKPQKDLQAFAKSKGINYRIARVTPSIVDAFGQADDIPTLLILDQEGRIQFRHTGEIPSATLSERVRSLLATPRLTASNGR